MSDVNSAKPYGIAKRTVWEAYQQVKANRGAAGVDEERHGASRHHQVAHEDQRHERRASCDDSKAANAGVSAHRCSQPS